MAGSLMRWALGDRYLPQCRIQAFELFLNYFNLTLFTRSCPLKGTSVTAWRASTLVLLLVLVGVPVVMPFCALLQHPSAWQAWWDSGHFVDLTRNTALLVGGTLAVAMPLGIILAIL